MNQPVDILETKILSDKKYLLEEVSFVFKEGRGVGLQQRREVYKRNNSTTVLLYNTMQKTIILTRQFRLPTYLSGNRSGMMIESCAGIMDEGESPEACIRREALEETGYQLETVEQIYKAFMSPASVTEQIHFFIAPYHSGMKVKDGGGLEGEQEYIEVLELPFDEAYSLIAKGDIRDAKTIMLLQYIRLQGIL